MRRLGQRCWGAAVFVMAACGSTADPLPSDDEPVVYTVRGYRIEDYTGVASQGLIDSIGAALEATEAAILAFLPEFPAFTDTLIFELRQGASFPYVLVDELRIIQYEDDLALEYLPHHLAHLLTGYHRRPFLEDGIAVYATEVLESSSVIANPYRGQPPHAWVALFEQRGSTIPLATALGALLLDANYEGSTTDASAWQVFVEAGSFTRWVFATFGRDAWYQWFSSDDLTGSLGVSVADLESEWLRAATLQYPDPLSCEAALATRGPLGTREEFWCARARGE